MGENAFKSVWFRRTKLPDLKNIPIDQKHFLLTAIESFTKNIFSIIDAKWMSNPLAVYHAENKLLQLKTAREIGFSVPETLITNNRDDLIHFYNEHKGNLIIKPIAQTRLGDAQKPSFIFPNKLTSNLIDRINEFELTPCIFQENIEKEYELRITVVGNKVFPAAVDSQNDEETSIDWRRKKLIFRKIEIPCSISDLCVHS